MVDKEDRHARLTKVSRTGTVGSLDTRHALQFKTLARFAGVLGGWLSARARSRLDTFTAVC